MANFKDYGSVLDQPVKPRPQGRRLADIGQRLAQTFSRADGAEQGFAPAEASDRWAEQPTEQHVSSWEEHMPRFAMVRRGYHCASVDQYVAELEQELAALDQEIAVLRAQTAPSDEVAAEIKRVGEQTSAVLIAAHEQARETMRAAEAEAEGRITGAQSEAAAIVGRANQAKRELELETQRVQSQRERLLGDVKSAAGALSGLVDASLERMPAQPALPEAEPSQPASDSSPVPA